MIAKQRRVKNLRQAVTLVEVVAAAVIFSIAAVSLLTAQSAGLKQLATAKLELTSQGIAKNLMAQWNLTKEDIRLAAGDVVDNHKGWHWRRENEQVTVSNEVRATEIILTLEHHGDVTWARTYRWWLESDSHDRS